MGDLFDSSPVTWNVWKPRVVFGGFKLSWVRPCEIPTASQASGCTPCTQRGTVVPSPLANPGTDLSNWNIMKNKSLFLEDLWLEESTTV